jgi:hypothetical protein
MHKQTNQGQQTTALNKYACMFAIPSPQWKQRVYLKSSTYSNTIHILSLEGKN